MASRRQGQGAGGGRASTHETATPKAPNRAEETGTLRTERDQKPTIPVWNWVGIGMPGARSPYHRP